jgi:hypothetical protein
LKFLGFMVTWKAVAGREGTFCARAVSMRTSEVISAGNGLDGII